MKAYLACDGGGTKTDFVLFTPDGHVLSRLVLGGTNPNAVGMDTACARLLEGARTLSETASPAYFFAGVAGSASGENGKRIAEALGGALPALPFSVGSDIWNVFYSADCGPQSLAAITGTGSIVYARDGETLERFGGWGYLFDHAGSGYDLGRDAITHALACDDGMAARSALTELVEARLGGSAKARLDLLYREGRDYIASFAPSVFEAARAGDGTAEAILARNAGRLAELIRFAHGRSGGSEVILAGGLTRHASWLEAIRSELPEGLTIVLPALPPVFGAARRTLALAGEPEGPEFRENFEKGIAENTGAL